MRSILDLSQAAKSRQNSDLQKMLEGLVALEWIAEEQAAIEATQQRQADIVNEIAGLYVGRFTQPEIAIAAESERKLQAESDRLTGEIAQRQALIVQLQKVEQFRPDWL